jgi:hypothetical protein
MTETTQRDRLLVADSATRKTYPMFSGLLAYFPDALAYVAWVSHQGNEKHNPGEPLHHARGKSMDHADCCARHLTRHGQFDGDVRESGALAWRALALLQEELEKAHGLPLPRGAKTEGGSPVIPAAGGYIAVKQKPGESMSEAICRTALGAQKSNPVVQRESRHGFTVGDMVKVYDGQRGTVVGFDNQFVLVDTTNYPRGGWYPSSLKLVPQRTEPLT